ncbi:MAG: phosphatidylinositol-specific phospholipase C/glycerophosphodiester phosphodiesterase family protein [Limisphaerales bacterium]
MTRSDREPTSLTTATRSTGFLPVVVPILVLFLTLTLPTMIGRVSAASPPLPIPLPTAHSHNDYEHTRPLLDALDQGFCSVEADIYLVDGELLVAHDRPKVRPERTLQALYLDPLQARVKAHGGRVHPGGPSVTLLIDFKGDADTTYARLREVLAAYRPMLTVFSNDRTVTNAVTIVISGNRPWKTLASEPERLAGLDGRLPDLDTNPSPHLVPLVSDNWRSHFQWNGEGPLPESEKAKLHELVRRAHSQGRRIRFWAAADRPEVWRAQAEARVDLINTDRLEALAAHLLTRP